MCKLGLLLLVAFFLLLHIVAYVHQDDFCLISMKTVPQIVVQRPLCFCICDVWKEYMEGNSGCKAQHNGDALCLCVAVSCFSGTSFPLEFPYAAKISGLTDDESFKMIPVKTPCY